MRFLTGGESHGPELTGILEGLPAGIELDIDKINHELARRQAGYGRNLRMQIEHDQVQIRGGFIYGKTTGAPLVMAIRNKDYENWEEKWKERTLDKLNIPRPGHADLAGMQKYRLDDARIILERASARETAMRVAIGAVCKQLLALAGVNIYSYVVQIGSVKTEPVAEMFEEAFNISEASQLRCPVPETAEKMQAAIDLAKENGDTIGGVIQVVAESVPVGLGSHVHWDRRLDGRIGGAMLSIPAMKGMEIGDAYSNVERTGSNVHDEIHIVDGKISRKRNRAGGIEGGISNGEPIVVKVYMKPIPTVTLGMPSIELSTMKEKKAEYQRSDTCAVPSATVVCEAMLAWVLADAYMEKFGGDSVQEVLR
ncbi:MAG: chorismate synthase [Anaerolineaceae bacterium]|nr:chorismate synthase [Anaerolineaceae bacterium]